MKTPKEMAEEYVSCEDFCGEEAAGAYSGFLAGYRAAQRKDKAVNRTHLAWKLAENYGAVKWLKHKDSKRFGSAERQYEYTIARDGFYQGYQAAKPEWISVKDRLPDEGIVLVVMPKGTITLGICYKKTQQFDVFLQMGIVTAEPTHWMPLPEPPKEEG